MRCFFHLNGRGEEILDQHGIEVESLEEARTEALKAIAELRREEPPLQHEWHGWQLRIVDEAGRALSTIRLSSVIHPIGGTHFVGRSEDKHPPPIGSDAED
ncbi:DUF6894 family protein [Enterovirga aerilata]|uniref:DUF6894 family protein n=1 Tax=Enterovirga aerilata TaxID=2730920 RepID=UPI001581A87A|nr:hypothetical protein [Enterovirga sp. DB1703]